MIYRIAPSVALAFLSLFPEFTRQARWNALCAHIGSGGSIPAIFLGAFSEGLAGVFPVQINGQDGEIHAAFLPGNRGKFAVDSARQAFEILFRDYGLKLIYANITEPHVAEYARRCGMTENNGRFEVSRWAVL